MWDKLLEFALQRRAPNWVLAICFVVGGGITYLGQPIIQKYLSQQEAQENRISALKLEDWQTINNEVETFNVALQSFTRDLIENKPVPEELRNQMIGSLVRQYSDLNKFSAYLPLGSVSQLKNYQTAINQLRRSILETNSSADLDQFYVTFKEFTAKQLKIFPILAEAAGQRPTS